MDELTKMLTLPGKGVTVTMDAAVNGAVFTAQAPTLGGWVNARLVLTEEECQSAEAVGKALIAIVAEVRAAQE